MQFSQKKKKFTYKILFVRSMQYFNWKTLIINYSIKWRNILRNIKFYEIPIRNIIINRLLFCSKIFQEYEKEDNYKELRASRGDVYGTFANNRYMPRLSFVPLTLRCLISTITDISRERDNHGNALWRIRRENYSRWYPLFLGKLVASRNHC